MAGKRQNTEPRCAFNGYQFDKRNEHEFGAYVTLPPDREFLDLCDSLGLFVLDELTGWQKPMIL
jgi:hypothetical protein